MKKDTLRSVALAGSCACFVTIPNLGALTGSGEKTERYDTVITPPGYAFTVWAPIFASCLIDTVAQCRRDGRRRESSRATGWPLSAAYLLNTIWSVAAQTDRFAATPVLLPAATGCTALAYRRLQHTPTDPAHSTTAAAGLLLGWTALASTVNVIADALRRGATPDSRRTTTVSTLALATTAAGLTVTNAIARRGAPALAATASWGLVTTALERRRPAPVRAVAGFAASVLVTVTALARARTNRH